MPTYLIGDIHGCYDELITLLTKIKFVPGQDTLWLTGDLVARGPKSLEVLRYVKSIGNSVRIVLGNHDLHVLSVHAGVSYNKPENRITPLLRADDADELINWLRQQPLLQIDEEKRLVMSHAGIIPQWDLETAKICANDVKSVLESNSFSSFFNAMHNRNAPRSWSKDLHGLARLCFITNVFTRMRYCLPNGQLEMHYKDAPENVTAPIRPWFALPRLVKDYSIAFGHWASLGGKSTSKGVYPLDTGCCWGQKLTCLRWEDKTYFVQSSKQSTESQRR